MCRIHYTALRSWPSSCLPGDVGGGCPTVDECRSITYGLGVSNRVTTGDGV